MCTGWLIPLPGRLCLALASLVPPLARRDAVEQCHQVPNLDVFERMHGILDLPAQPLVSAAGYEPVELFDGVLPSERMGSEARVVLNLVLDHHPVLKPDGD